MDVSLIYLTKTQYQFKMFTISYYMSVFTIQRSSIQKTLLGDDMQTILMFIMTQYVYENYVYSCIVAQC